MVVYSIVGYKIFIIFYSFVGFGMVYYSYWRLEVDVLYVINDI